MFENYEIKTINNEEVLFLYISNNVEFAKLDSTHKKTTISNHITNYLKALNVKFKGKKVILVASGLIIGACLFTTPIIEKNSYKADYQYTTNIIALNENLNPNIKIEEVIEDLAKTEQEETTTDNTKKESFVIKKENTTSNKTNNKTTSSNSTKTTTPTTSNTANTKNPTTSKNDNAQNSISNNTSKQETNASNKSQMVTIKRSNGTIINLELEEYLIGVAAAEMPASFNIEALKAQAIAARTYALKAIESNITLTDTVSTQVYKDNDQLKKSWGNSFNIYYNKVKKAVNETSGLVMYYNNTLINAFYHSTSNGYTEDSSYVFGEYPYLKSVASPVDQKVSSYLKTTTLSYENISNKLGIPITSLSSITIERNNSNRISKIIIDNNTYDGVKFRTILGLRSTDFDIELNENNISITTRGYGHGVGMSQYGANEYAKSGWNYSKILKHYYTGITIKKFN